MSEKRVSDLGPGDLVVIKRTHSEDRFARIDRVTKTQLVLGNGAKYNRRTGNIVGGTGSFYVDFVRVPTERDFKARSVRERQRVLRGCVDRIGDVIRELDTDADVERVGSLIEGIEAALEAYHRTEEP